MNLEGLKFLSHYITTLLHPSLIHTLPLHFIRSCNPPPSPLPLGPLPNPIALLPLPLNDNHCLHFIVPSPPPWQPLPLPLTVFISIPSQWHSLPLPLSSFHTSKFHTSPSPNPNDTLNFYLLCGHSLSSFHHSTSHPLITWHPLPPHLYHTLPFWDTHCLHVIVPAPMSILQFFDLGWVGENGDSFPLCKCVDLSERKLNIIRHSEQRHQWYAAMLRLPD